jgi:hypothetical protein
VKIVALILRYWSYLFAGLFGLFVAGIAAVLLISGSMNFRFSQLPFWQGKAALYSMLAIGLLGILGALLGLLKGMRPILLVWTLAVFALLVYGYFISPKHYFALGRAEAQNAAYLALGALLAFIGALMQYRAPRRA